MRRLSAAGMAAPDEDGVFAALAREMVEGFGVDQVHISRIAQDHSVGRGNAYYLGADGKIERGQEYVQAFDAISAVRAVVETGEPLNEPDAHNSLVLDRKLVERFGAASALFVPIAFAGEVRATLGLASETARRFSPGDVELAQTLAAQAAAAIGVLEMRDRLRRRAEQQTALARAASALNARLDLRAVLDTLCREADLALGGDLAGVYLGDAESGGLGVAGHGMPAGSDWFGYRIAAGEGVGGQVLATGEPAISNAYQEEVDLPDNDALRGIETAVSVPMCWNGELKGALSVAFHRMRRIEAEDIDGLQAIADLAAVACANAEAFEHAQVAARTDSLTGLLNHGALRIRVREEISRARRSGHPLSCILIDLDNFKPVNDGDGHLAGDQLLQEVADALAAEFRPYDGVGRFGGDEFVVVIPDADGPAAYAVAERVRELIARIRGGDERHHLSASIGVASWREPLTAGELLDRADRALLVAKRRGKNRVVAAGPDTEEELARLEAHGAGPAELLSGLWDMVSRCERPGDVLAALPAYLREALDVEEVVLLPDEALAHTGALRERAASGPISRPTRAELREALGLPAASATPGEPHGAWAALPIGREGRLHGLLMLRCSAHQFPIATLRLAELLAGQAVTAALGQSGGASRSAVGALAAAIDARDNYTHAHSEQVVALACAVTESLGLSAAEGQRVRDGAMLHDVGKVAIPNEILYKPGPLTEDEWKVMREHPVIGERIVLRTPELRPIAPLVRHEHERWDGGGYPDGLRGEQIPIGSRIIFACDAYNAMITARPYREPMTSSEALAEIRTGSGSQFDPAVVDALLAVLEQGGQSAVPSSLAS